MQVRYKPGEAEQHKPEQADSSHTAAECRPEIDCRFERTLWNGGGGHDDHGDDDADGHDHDHGHLCLPGPRKVQPG